MSALSPARQVLAENIDALKLRRERLDSSIETLQRERTGLVPEIDRLLELDDRIREAEEAADRRPESIGRALKQATSGYIPKGKPAPDCEQPIDLSGDGIDDARRRREARKVSSR